MRTIQLLFLALLGFAVTGCHHIANDYDRYLSNASGQLTLPSSDLESKYSLSDETVNHKYKFRSFTVGIANLWIVDFGRMLETQLDSRDVQFAFGRLTKQNGEAMAGENVIRFDLKDYQFSNFSAHVDMRIAVMNGADEIFSHDYRAVGQRQGGKMFWGGAMAMRNAIHQSTHYAINDILSDFINDLNDQALLDISTPAVEEVSAPEPAPAAVV